MTTQAQAQAITSLLDRVTRFMQTAIWKYLVYAIAIVVTVFLFFFNLSEYPAPWGDEGDALHVAENYAERGVYSDFSSEGDHYMGPVLSIGPTVILPVAFLYDAFEVSYPLARVVAVAYSVLMLLSLYLVSRMLVDARYAVLVVVVAFLCRSVHPLNSFIEYSRTVLGDIPTLFYLFLGLWLWLSPGKKNVPLLTLVGVCFGLACITKVTYASFILGTLFLSWILDIFWYRQRKWYYFVIPGILAGLMYVGWTYFSIYVNGADVRDVAEDVKELQAGQGAGYFVMVPRLLGRNLVWVATSAMYIGLLVPALIYGLILSAKRTEDGQRWSIFWMLTVFSAGFFVLSIGWVRLSIPYIVFSTVFVIRLLYDMTDGLRFDVAEVAESFKIGKPTQKMFFYFIAASFLLIVVGLGLLMGVFDVLLQGSEAVYQTGDFLNENVPESALIETWEEDIPVVTDHQFHYPPQEMTFFYWKHFMDESDPSIIPPSIQYDFREYVDADYVIVGPFGRTTEIYTPERLENFELIQTFGEYDIYQKVAE
jgi:hypothetical protein